MKRCELRAQHPALAEPRFASHRLRTLMLIMTVCHSAGGAGIGGILNTHVAQSAGGCHALLKADKSATGCADAVSSAAILDAPRILDFGAGRRRQGHQTHEQCDDKRSHNKL